MKELNLKSTDVIQIYLQYVSSFCFWGLGSVGERVEYDMAKGYIPEDRPNLLEIIEQTTYIGFDDMTYMEGQFCTVWFLMFVFFSLFF